ncbi:MAG: NAD(P)-dependent oxidoreductase [Hyphomicrobiales bacterium]|nr:NAD(P)-dependent oxidoreductase [Hyphomicrobiales bacterium]
MATDGLKEKTIGWIGIGRMGYAMARRLLDAGVDLTVYNRTRAKAEPLLELGAKIVDTAADLADRDIVFSMVSGPQTFVEVTTGDIGLLSGEGPFPSLLIDCTTISAQASATVRKAATAKGVSMIDAPVSGNAKVVEAGLLSIVASGERAAFDQALPYLEAIAEGVTYVGEGELARTVKICHNLFLAAVTQSLAEVTVLAEKCGVPRSALLDFINKSVMGSRFSKYKTPAFVNLDYTPTFTSALLRKDLDLGLDVAHDLDVPLPVTEQVRGLVQALIDSGHADNDFAALLELQAKAAGLDLEPENREVGTGLET